MDGTTTRRSVLAASLVGLGGLTGVTGCGVLPGEPAPRASDNPAFGDAAGTGELDLTSPEVTESGGLPNEYGHAFRNVNPPLVVEGVPDRARSLALVMEGPDVPGGAVIYWLVWNIPPDVGRIPEAWNPPEGVVQGANSSGASEYGYVGPSPPNRQTVRFKLFALDRRLDLPRGADKRALGDAMAGHILARTQLTVWYDFHTAAHDTISTREHVNLVDDVCVHVRDLLPGGNSG